MMGTSRTIFLLLLILSSAQAGIRFYAFLVKDHTKGECKYTGYVPGGKTVEVKKINAPTATLQGQAMTAMTVKFAGAAVTGISEAMKSAKAIETFAKLASGFAKIAPALGPALGVFGAVLGGIADMTKPRPEDILRAVNKAIAKLTDEVNDRMVEMKGYVDKRVIDLEHSLIDREYKTLFLLWSNCINELEFDEVNRCQRDAAKTIIAAKGKFMISAHYSNVYNMKRVEATLLSFRDYAVLDIMCLKALVDTYKGKTDAKSRRYFNRFNKELKKEVNTIVSYVTKVVDDIIKMHTDNNNRYGTCDKTFKCNGMHAIREGFWLSKVHTADWTECSCVFDGADVATKTCKDHITIRVDGKRPGRPYKIILVRARRHAAAAKEGAHNKLNLLGKTFVQKMKKVIEAYWQNEVLCLVPVWKKMAASSSMGKKDEIMTDLDDEEEPYSSQYHLRLAKAMQMADEFGLAKTDNNDQDDDGSYEESMDEMY